YLIGPLLKRFGKFFESEIEHRSHEKTEGTALELIIDEKFDIALTSVSHRLEGPAVVEIAKRPVEIFYINDVFLGLQQHLTGKCLTDKLVTNCHVGNEKRLSVTLLAGANRQGLAHWQ